MHVREIRAGVVYQTARDELRRVLRITARAVHYELVSSRKPGYRFAMLTPAFAATAVRERQELGRRRRAPVPNPR
jgi:hypothetical protein